jgi:SOS-response transcriptional repressor LexA/DNA-binding XRE family transcriptional regulator
VSHGLRNLAPSAEIGQRVAELRRGTELQQIAFARLLGVSHTTISQVEAGKQGMSAILLELIESRFGVRREWLETGASPSRYPRWTEWTMALGAALQAQMLKAGHVQIEQAAQIAGVSSDEMQLIYLGRMFPSPAALEALATRFKLVAVWKMLDTGREAKAIPGDLGPADWSSLRDSVSDVFRRGSERELRLFEKFFRLFQTSIEFVDTNSKARRDSQTQLRLLGPIAAGRPIEAIASETLVTVPGLETILQEWRLSADKCFALRVRGESMIGFGINDGDTVVVEAKNVAQPNDIVVALLRGEATLKRLHRKRNGELELQAGNPKTPPIAIPQEGVVIQGVARGVLPSVRTVE